MVRVTTLFLSELFRHSLPVESIARPREHRAPPWMHAGRAGPVAFAPANPLSHRQPAGGLDSLLPPRDSTNFSFQFSDHSYKISLSPESCPLLPPRAGPRRAR